MPAHTYTHTPQHADRARYRAKASRDQGVGPRRREHHMEERRRSSYQPTTQQQQRGRPRPRQEKKEKGLLHDGAWQDGGHVSRCVLLVGVCYCQSFTSHHLFSHPPTYIHHQVPLLSLTHWVHSPACMAPFSSTGLETASTRLWLQPSPPSTPLIFDSGLTNALLHLFVGKAVQKKSHGAHLRHRLLRGREGTSHPPRHRCRHKPPIPQQHTFPLGRSSTRSCLL